jgi:hypothetical protein
MLVAAVLREARKVATKAIMAAELLREQRFAGDSMNVSFTKTESVRVLTRPIF